MGLIRFYSTKLVGIRHPYGFYYFVFIIHINYLINVIQFQ